MRRFAWSTDNMAFYVLWRFCMFLLGLLWCKEIFERFPKDYAEFRTTEDKQTKGVIAFYWLVTICIIFAMALFLWHGLRSVYEVFFR
jgi:hypothetical protein